MSTLYAKISKLRACALDGLAICVCTHALKSEDVVARLLLSSQIGDTSQHFLEIHMEVLTTDEQQRGSHWDSVHDIVERVQ